MNSPSTAEPHIFVAFGATGDLMQRMLLPALYCLFQKGLVGERSLILGAALPTDVDDAAFRALARATLGDGPAEEFCNQRMYYQPMGEGTPQDYQLLATRITQLEQEHNLPGNRVFYLALPPAAVPSTIERLGEAGLNHSSGWTRVVIEKPFGHDLASAEQLNALLHRHFDESQIYRIDHYLGKETVQNLLVFRFANALFESVWNRDRIEKVEILVAETLGVEHRAAYYEHAGAMRDMVQNHLTQLLAATAMELPAAFDADAIRDEKLKVLRAVAPIRPDDVACGQYARGHMDGEDVPGYREEPGVAPDSPIETFIALKLEIANYRWYGVPFYLQTGKHLPQRLSQIAVTFRHPPASIFQPLGRGDIHPNILVIALQPDEGFDLHFEMKVPGRSIRLATNRLHFRFAEAFEKLPSAYEALLLDILLGDQTLFVRADWEEASWRMYTPLLEQMPAVQFYPAGTWGPPALDRVSWPPQILPAHESTSERKEP